MSHAPKLLGTAAVLFAASSLAAQVNYTENFDVDAAGWTADGTATFAPFAHFSDATTCSTGAMRTNLYNTTANGNDILLSPALGTSTGASTTISYSYKINLWSANTAPTPAPWGSIDVEYTDDPVAGTWTNIATITDEVQSGSCITKSHTFTPPAGPLFVRFNCNRTGGDSWWNIDDISVIEAGSNPPATHTNYGSGCYDIGNSIYQEFADAAVAGPALSGNVLELTPNGSGGYDAAWLAGAAAAHYVTPTGTPLTISDDGEVDYVSAGFPSPYGPVTDLRVHGNGIVSFGSTPISFGGNNYQPTAAKFFNGTSAAVYAWHDYNNTEAGSGSIIAEDTGGMTLVTFDGVESYSTPAGPNPSTLQFQFDQTTGVINVVFVSIDTDPTSTFGSAHLIGFRPATSTIDGGSVDLATALPASVGGAETDAISLSASPAPVSTAGTGTTVTYQIDNIPDANVSSGIYFGTVILSFTPDLAGSDLGFIGMPDCNLYVGGLDVLIAYNGVSASQSVNLNIPAGVAVGTELWAQAAALVFPGSLPNGQNSFGAVVSNGVASFISDN